MRSGSIGITLLSSPVGNGMNRVSFSESGRAWPSFRMSWRAASCVVTVAASFSRTGKAPTTVLLRAGPFFPFSRELMLSSEKRASFGASPKCPSWLLPSAPYCRARLSFPPLTNSAILSRCSSARRLRSASVTSVNVTSMLVSASRSK